MKPTAQMLCMKQIIEPGAVFYQASITVVVHLFLLLFLTIMHILQRLQKTIWSLTNFFRGFLSHKLDL